MLNSREVAKPKLIDNLERVADNLVDCLASITHSRELVQPINDASKEYTKPLNSWLWFPVYFWSRKRGPVLNALIATINQSGSSDSLLEAIDQFFSFGGWETTSANTILLKDLVMILPGYSDTKEEFSLQHNDILRLKELVLLRTNNILRPSITAIQQAELDDNLTRQHAEQRRKELGNLPKRNVRQEGEELNQNAVFHGPNKSQRNRLDENKFGQLRLKLEAMLKARLEGDQAAEVNEAKPAAEGNVVAKEAVSKNGDTHDQPTEEKAAMQFIVGKLDKQRVTDLENALKKKMQGDVETAAANMQISDSENSIHTPPSSPQFSAAAYEATVATEKYVAPERKKLVLTDTQMRSMNRLFSEPMPVESDESTQEASDILSNKI